jgi:hypothetical protein
MFFQEREESPLQRTWKFKAWIVSSEEEALRQAQRVRYEFVQAAQMENVMEARKQFGERLKDLWTPNRQEPSRWIDAEHRRYLSVRKKRDLGTLDDVIQNGWSGLLFGVFHTVPKERTWEDVIERGREDKYLVRTRLVDGKGDKPIYEVEMPLWMDREKPKLRFRFLAHRPFPEGATFNRFFLAAWPKVREGKIIGYRWEIGMRLELPDPESRLARRLGIWTPRWKPELDGRILVGELLITYLDHTSKTVLYHLPAGTISRARRVHHLSLTGKDTVEYEQFARWREDQYRKMAMDVTRRVDAIEIKKINAVRTQHKDPRKYRAMVSAGLLSNIIDRTARREGLLSSR